MKRSGSPPTTHWGACAATLLAVAAVGCQQVPLGQPPLAADPQQVGQLESLQQRANQLDVANRDLHRQVAGYQQQTKLLEDRITLLNRQLSDTADRLAAVTEQGQGAASRLQAIEAATQRRGGAIITPNNSLKQSLAAIQIPGIEIRPDGDVVRIELPADKLFVPYTPQLRPEAFGLIDRVASAIAQAYPRNIIGIEGHTDNAPISNAQMRNAHQLTVAQAQMTFEQLVSRARFSSRRLFVLGHGPNHPLVSNATPQGQARNRRIELVIYPDESR